MTDPRIFTVVFRYTGISAIGSGPVSTAAAGSDGLPPRVLIDPPEQSGGVVKGRWLFDSLANDGRNAIYDLDEEPRDD